MKNRTVLGGLFLVIVGCLMLLNNLAHWNLFSMARFWPLFILVPGLIFEWSYFSTRRNPGLLVPGGILTALGVLFFFETLTGWFFAAYTWPVYPLSVAIGLFQLYLFSGRPKGLLIPVLILTAVSVLSFGIMFVSTLTRRVDLSIVFPIVVILIGLVLIFQRSGPKSQGK